MQLTKYPQSCAVAESNDARLVIGPGNFVVNKYDAAEFGPLDAVLYSHRHAEHQLPRRVSVRAGV